MNGPGVHTHRLWQDITPERKTSCSEMTQMIIPYLIEGGSDQDGCQFVICDEAVQGPFFLLCHEYK